MTAHPPGPTDSAGQAWAGRTLRPNPFAGDDGSLQPDMAAALAVADPGERVVAVVEELRRARVLVPVVAHEHPGTDDRGQVREHAGSPLRGDAAASAATVTVRTPDGRAALPIFSSMAALARWDARARPVPVEGARAAVSAVEDADSLLVLDPADGGVLLPRPAVWAVARGLPWTPSWADPDLPGVVTAALRGIEELVGVRLERGGRAELRIVLAVRRDVPTERVRTAVDLARAVLGEDRVLRERVDSLELTPAVLA